MNSEKRVLTKKEKIEIKRLEQIKKEQELEKSNNDELNSLKELRNNLNKDINFVENEIENFVIKKRKIRKVKRAFLKRRKRIKGKERPVEELQEYVLILQKNNGHADILEGVQAGEFYMKSASGKEEKSIMLTPDKLTTFNYNGMYFKGWMAGEDNVSPYPQQPLHNAETYRKTTQKLAMNYRDVNEAKFMEAKTKQVIMYVLLALLVGYVFYIMAKNGKWFEGKEVVQTTAQVVADNTVNTGVVVN